MLASSPGSSDLFLKAGPGNEWGYLMLYLFSVDTVRAPVCRVIHIFVIKLIKFVQGHVREARDYVSIWIVPYLPPLSLHHVVVSVSLIKLYWHSSMLWWLFFKAIVFSTIMARVDKPEREESVKFQYTDLQKLFCKYKVHMHSFYAWLLYVITMWYYAKVCLVTFVLSKQLWYSLLWPLLQVIYLLWLLITLILLNYSKLMYLFHKQLYCFVAGGLGINIVFTNLREYVTNSFFAC